MVHGEFIGLVAVFGAFGLPALWIWTGHRRRILEIKLRANTVTRTDDSVLSAIDQMRSEIRALRDTTTQYDISFDSALQRMERRVDSLENHTINQRTDVSHIAVEEVQTEVRVGR